MGIFSAIFGSSNEGTLKTCKRLYQMGKQIGPGRSERDYLKAVLITKPPFDYQADQLLDDILDSCNSIEDLASVISEHGKSDDLWEVRERNTKSAAIKARNDSFARSFRGH